ncbi:hypothetical protein [Candidatus Tokpelaia sp.]|uniref:hypothetical protein n=1 Tax=Candidatus Tokpelaia sp. TaxID=2233777 RepID=UPI001239D505|nr:hypothetical protein [Candidatus Tokpelaia sp.]KAA6404671.1 hypothetical protein DPQ22_06930 [Candidatus Tokpelaia sp.]
MQKSKTLTGAKLEARKAVRKIKEFKLPPKDYKDLAHLYFLMTQALLGGQTVPPELVKRIPTRDWLMILTTVENLKHKYGWTGQGTLPRDRNLGRLLTNAQTQTSQPAQVAPMVPAQAAPVPPVLQQADRAAAALKMTSK